MSSTTNSARGWIGWLTILALALGGSSVSAEKRAVPLKAGEPAPFDGDLLTPSLSLSIGARAERCEAMLRIETEALDEKCAAKLEGAATMRTILVDAHDREVARLTRALEEESDHAVRLSESLAAAREQRARWAQIAGTIGVVVGVVSTVAIGVASVWVTSQLAGVAIARSP